MYAIIYSFFWLFLTQQSQLKQIFNMAKSMLEYYKTVLQKVSFDVKLFSKELKKAISKLLPDEIEELKVWLQNFITDKPELQPTLIYLNA